MRQLFLIVFIAGCLVNAEAQTKTASNGLWANNNTWSPSGVPVAGDNVIIPNGITVSVKSAIYGTLPDIFITVHGVLDFDPSGKLDLGVNSTIQLSSSGQITTNGTGSELIKIGNSEKYNGSVDGNMVGPIYSSQFTGNSPSGFMMGILPIKLISFRATLQNYNVQLKWVSEKEIDGQVYQLQKSTDGIHYDIVSNIESKVNGGNVVSYDYTDKNISKSELYYRLKLIDADGKFEYSGIAYVNNKNSRNKNVSFRSNSFNGDIQIIGLPSNELSTKTMKVYNSVGQEIPYIITGANSIKIQSHVTGLYILRVKDQTFKFFRI